MNVLPIDQKRAGPGKNMVDTGDRATNYSSKLYVDEDYMKIVQGQWS